MSWMEQTDTPGDSCPVDGCDYGAGQTMTGNQYRGHINASPAKSHDWGRYRDDVKTRVGGDVDDTSDTTPSEGAESKDVNQQETDEGADEYEEQWSGDKEDDEDDDTTPSNRADAGGVPDTTDDGDDDQSPITSKRVVAGACLLILAVGVVVVIRRRTDGSPSVENTDNETSDEGDDEGGETTAGPSPDPVVKR
ncbi:hypothetical protein [Halocalculus aciditolerans]|uniref:Uncharacterized protein n=1 Tax=Halocalculus aciditolerans TaxID=1383812 RepID=A0A830FJ45_9EURY|nr:hypothetical protein [Halocalculus aciditolerans]GGL57878.1 hypothetical protein GCM10009039_15060 [Halocalculus aciditolerans]